MAKAQNKTQPTEKSVDAFLDGIEHPVRKADGLALLDLFKRVTGLTPKMWGPTIVGFGRYKYHYKSGREGEFLITGFSPRKASLSLYLLPGYDDLSEPLSRLGKHKLGQGCLYVNKLADIDLAVLEEMIKKNFEKIKTTHETFDD